MTRSKTPTTDASYRTELASLTIPQAIAQRATDTPLAPVIRYKQYGLYVTRTWREYHRDIETFAIGLKKLGLKQGDSLSIIGDPGYFWMVADAAIMTLRGISFGIYTTCSQEEIQYQLDVASASMVVVENQEYVDKVLRLKDSCPSVKKIIVDDIAALFSYTDERITSVADIFELGRREFVANIEELRRVRDSGNPRETALLVFTSGTTGMSKAAEISHRNFLVGGALQFCEMFPQMSGPGERRVMAHLSLAHAFERIFALYTPIISTEVVHIGDDLESLPTTLFEVQPFYFHAVPRIWQKMAAKAITDIERSSWLKRFTYHLAMKIARRYRDKKWNNKSTPATGVLYQVARGLVFRPMLRKFGLAHAVYGLTAGTHIPDEVQAVWQCWGLNLVNGLGMTEVGYVAFQTDPFPKPGDVGYKVPGLEVALDDEGELVYRGEGVFKGYLKDPEKSAEALSTEGWFKSGDSGSIDSAGRIELVGRKKDIMVTAGGKNITPAFIENLMRASSYVSEFVVIADNRKFPSALVEIDFATVSEWAKNKALVFTGFTSLTQLPEVEALIAQEISLRNEHLAQVEKIKKFRIIPRELDPEDGDTTPTRKIRRKYTENLFSDLINEMYQDELEELKLLARQ
ncbi:MAG: AMP-dependent synthetase/ligase [Ilumatobacteraceae bacterium]